MNRHHSLLELPHWLYAGGFAAVNATCTQLRDPINSELARWGSTVKMDAIAEIGRGERSPWVSTRSSLGVENELADAGRGGRTRLERPNSWAGGKFS